MALAYCILNATWRSQSNRTQMDICRPGTAIIIGFSQPESYIAALPGSLLCIYILYAHCSLPLPSLHTHNVRTSPFLLPFLLRHPSIRRVCRAY